MSNSKRRYRNITTTFPLFLLVVIVTLRGRNRNTNSFMFQLSSPTLSPSALDTLHNASFEIQGRKTVVVTAATSHYAPFLENLRCWMRRQPTSKLIVFAFDEKMLKYARQNGFDTVNMTRAEEKRNLRFGGEGFISVTKRKLEVMHSVLNAGFDVLFTDLDIVWCADCARKLALMASEGLPRETIFVQNDSPRDGHRVVRFNSGFYFVRSSNNTIRMFKEMVEYAAIQNDPYVTDQVVFNRITCKHAGNGRQLSRQEHGRKRVTTVCLWDERVEIETLPLAEYANGDMFVGKTKIFDLEEGIIGKWCREGKLSMLHNNWISGEDAKKKRFKWGNLWIWQEHERRCLRDR